MLERLRRRESLLFPLPPDSVRNALEEIRKLAKQTRGFNTQDQNMHMELKNPDLHEFIRGRKQGYRENPNIEDSEYQAYVTGVAIAFKAIEDSVNKIGISMPKVRWREIRKYESKRIKAWTKIDKESHGKTDFVTSVFNSLLEEDPSFEDYMAILPEPQVGDTTGFVILQDGGWVLPPDPASNPLLLQYNMRRFYTCVGISDVYFPIQRADARANRRK